MLEILTALLGKTLNLPAERIADILFKKADDGAATDQIADDALDKFLEAHAAHIETLKGAADGGKQFDNGYKKGKSEALTELEKQLRKDFATESTAQGIELVRHIVTQAAASKGKTLDDDAVKSHPLYVKLEREAKEASDAVRTELQEKITELETGYAKRERFAKVQEKIMAAFEALRPVLPTSPTAASTVRSEFMSRFADFDYDIADDGSVIVKKDGKRVENRHGHAVSLDDLVRQEAEVRFDFAKQEPKGNAANGNGTGTGATTTGADGFTPPANMDEFQKRLYDHGTTADERSKLYEWKRTQQGGEG